MPLNIDWQQILLHLLNFVILFAGLWLLLYKPVRKFMNDRRRHYEETDAASEQKNADAEEKRAAYEKKLEGADAEIEEMRAAARREMESYASECREAAQREAAEIVAEARESAQHERERTVREARGEIAEIVAEAAEKVVLHEDVSEVYETFLNAAGMTEEEAAPPKPSAKQGKPKKEGDA